mmetsp:Transcript_12393/g.18789  ORF Transcript_12393/g.18789 Transcript_12393/m.18789 type:complete len:206 (-) Transcript_12393:39-656(-)
MIKDEIDQITANCDYCEASLTQMKKDLIAYLRRKSAETKETAELSNMLRNIASTERNKKLQKSMFSIASTYGELDKLLPNYKQCESQTADLLAEARTFLLAPMREVVLDSNQALIKRDAKNNFDGNTHLQQRTLHMEAILPVHRKLFEKHRVKYMKGILKNLIYAELQYHCRSIELLSPLFQSLSEVDEEYDPNSNEAVKLRVQA